MRKLPPFVKPMLAKLSALPADESRWAFEVKWDGIRAIARCTPARLSLLTRNQIDRTAHYPELAVLTELLGSHTAMLDGEIVTFDEQGRPGFQGLAGHDAPSARLASYVVFDLLWLDGDSLLDLPYLERRERLFDLDLDGDRVKVPAHFVGEGTALLAASREQQLEGIVAKRLDSRYVPGGRGGEWLKIKNVSSQELVIGGWLPGQKGRAGRLGALLLGHYEPSEDGTLLLRFAGRVGTGFNDRELDRLAAALAARARKTSPFVGAQPPPEARFVRPDLVAEIEFREWTKAGSLRHPSYKGLREDKNAKEVVRERPA
jgi:bifunctional non-homologous end joining protein LigD